jgi:superfamily II DNA or RNA helicase
MEEDALGEELEVIWEIEPGARVLERAGLPKVDGFDDPERLRAFLHAVRWGAVTKADFDTLQAPFRAGITIEDYQLDSVVRAIRMPRANLLIADDVGLGKTIEAGLVIQELILRHRARTVLIVCPASLQIKWYEEMLSKFGLEFRIVDTQLLRELRRSRGIHVNPWSHFPRLITSIDWLKRETPMRMMRDLLPLTPTYPRRFDILVVDEAHNVAPSASGRYAVDSQRTKAIRTIAPHFQHRLFLTATPHNGYQESFTALLELIDDQRFARGVPPAEEQLRTVMVRRLKSDITDWKGDPMFPKRRIEAIEVYYTDEEQRAHQLLNEYTQLRRQAIEDEAGAYATEFVLKLLKKRLFSSPAAFANTLERHRRTLQEGSTKKESKPTIGLLRRAIQEVDEEYADDEAYEDSLDQAVATASNIAPTLTSREHEILDELTRWAESARERPDSKVRSLLEWLNKHIRPNGEWSDERVIIFTEYRATQGWLVEALTQHGFGGERLMTIYGGMDTEAREAVKAAFQASPQKSPVRILVATDAASEGIDLQNHCHLLIHAEIPWNPNRLEQRNGRIDRHGQRAKEVVAYHFVGAGWKERAKSLTTRTGDLASDLEFLYRAALKVDAIREDLGRVGPVIAEQIEKAMLRAGETHLDTEAAERQAKAARRQLAIERDIRERIARLHDRLLDTKRHLELEPENVERVVQVGLELAGQPKLRPVYDAGGAASGPRIFEMPRFDGSWRRCEEGLADPFTGERRPITFDHEVVRERDDVVLVHLEHRLVQMCLRVLRAEIWAPDSHRRLHRVTAEIVPDTILDTPGVVAHARLVVTSENRHRLHEEIISAGGVIRQGRFRRFDTVSALNEAIAAARPVLPSESMLEGLMGVWPNIEDGVVRALEARLDDRMQFLGNTLRRLRDREIADITEILEELGRSIAKALEEPEQEQLTLWTPTEREQLQRNLDSLRRRLEQIPEEIERESDVIRRRYADPSPSLFPVALTFLVPQSMGGR